MATAAIVHRPQRWDNPFSPDMTGAEVDRILSAEPFASMDPSRFPESASLRGIIRNDTCVRRYQRGDIVVRAGDYGTSAFLVLSGSVRVVLPPGLPDALLGREEPGRKGLWEAFSQVWKRPPYPEVRDTARYMQDRGTGSRRVGKDETRVYLADIEAVLERERTVTLGPGEMLGEIAALARIPRTTTVFADAPTELLELRWQGLRDIRRRDERFRDRVDRLYRERSLKAFLRETPVFRHLDDATIEEIAVRTLFESYGDFDWQTSYARIAEQGAEERLRNQPIIVSEGDYPDGLLMISSGFARVSFKLNHGERIVRYIGRGGIHGFEEIVHNWRTGESSVHQHTLRAVGYTDVLRVPTSILEDLVLPRIPEDRLPRRVERRRRELPVTNDRRRDASAAAFRRRNPAVPTDLMEFLVEYRYINGTATMLVDLDRCVRCDACVEACAVGHNNNPRFNRHGRRHGRYMVANACMHCEDPVCMLGCPTGAIHRSLAGGEVVINDDTCIGCATCANNCPYGNIRMVEVRDGAGRFIRDDASGTPLLKATKCDLCIDQLGGPACQRACAHDALIRVHMRDRPTLADWLNRK